MINWVVNVVKYVALWLLVLVVYQLFWSDLNALLWEYIALIRINFLSYIPNEVFNLLYLIFIAVIIRLFVFPFIFSWTKKND